MSIRQLTTLASIMWVCFAGSVSQPIPVDRQSKSSITSRQPNSPDQDDQSAADDDNDSSDDFQLASYTLDVLPSLAISSYPLWNESIIGLSHSSTSSTLESKHILLRV
jgi:hypothetical protein